MSSPEESGKLKGFGEQKLAPEALDWLKGHEGKLALLDGTTQLRVGVKRPQVILPESWQVVTLHRDTCILQFELACLWQADAVSS